MEPCQDEGQTLLLGQRVDRRAHAGGGLVAFHAEARRVGLEVLDLGRLAVAPLAEPGRERRHALVLLRAQASDLVQAGVHGDGVDPGLDLGPGLEDAQEHLLPHVLDTRRAGAEVAAAETEHEALVLVHQDLEGGLVSFLEPLHQELVGIGRPHWAPAGASTP